jgi:hypothetical protein
VKAKHLVLLAVALAGLRSARSAEPAPPSIVRIALPAEEDERQPVEVPTETENTVEVDFPWPLEDWAGRGFTPDAEKFAGDFVIEASRGKTRLFVTPVAAGAHRVLHVVLAGPGGTTRGVPVEFIPAPAGLAWRKVVFTGGKAPEEPRPSVSLDPRPPRSRLREPSRDSELGLIRTLRLMLSTTVEGAAAIAAANPALSLKVLDASPRRFGDFTIANRFALRDATTDTLGLCASVSNQTPRRLLFDGGSWKVRAGDRIYPVRTVDFASALEAGATAAVFLVLARGPDGETTLLLPENEFEISVVLSEPAKSGPARQGPPEGPDPR